MKKLKKLNNSLMGFYTTNFHEGTKLEDVFIGK